MVVTLLVGLYEQHLVFVTTVLILQQA